MITLVSVPTKGTHLLYNGLSAEDIAYTEFPSPRRGPIFSTRFLVGEKPVVSSFRPHEGDPSSLLKTWRMKFGAIGFRPHEGDPSSLLATGIYSEQRQGFRPHEGDPSSLQR